MSKKINIFLSGIILALLFSTVSGCSTSSSSSSNSGTDYTATIENTSAYIKSAITQYNLVGLSIALVDNDKIVWSQGFGYSNKETKTPATADTVYMIGSISKTLTTVGLLNLYDNGLVELDAPVISYLPEFDMKERYANQMQGITVRRLLDHHSGIPGDIYNSAFVEEMWDDWDDDLYINWLYSCLRNDYPTYAPGQVASYCNTGFVIAGEIVRKVGGGTTLTSYMQENLLAPLGMSHSSFRKITDNLAMGYIGGHPYEAVETNITATGGVFSTVTDMAQFMMMLLGEGLHPNGTRILKAGTVAMMGYGEESSLDVTSFFKPGLGFDSRDDIPMSYAGRAWFKDGSTTNFNSIMELLPDKKLGVIVLTNSDTAEPIKYSIARECLKNALIDKCGLRQSLPALPVMQSVHDGPTVAGLYAGSGSYHKVIDNGNGSLTIQVGANRSTPSIRTAVYDGTAYARSGGNEKYVFRNITWGGNNYFVLIQNGNSGSATDEIMMGGYPYYIFGQKFTPPAIPSAWSARIGKTYIIENIGFNELGWASPVITFSTRDGVLMGGKSGEQNVLVPDTDPALTDTVAFVPGINNRADSSVRVDNSTENETISFGGYQGYDIDDVPEINIGEVIIGQTEFHKTQWFKLTIVTPGQNLRFRIGGTDPQYTMILLGEDLGDPIEAGTGSFDWESVTGTYYMGITPSPADDSEYTMSITAS
jgi:CubicO group peptidase (beta-lactamase class C family)